jgi:hypothetical protein
MEVSSIRYFWGKYLALILLHEQAVHVSSSSCDGSSKHPDGDLLNLWVEKFRWVLKVMNYKLIRRSDASKTLEERLEKTPSNAPRFAQRWFLKFSPILEGLVGTAHGTVELGLCSHRLAYQAGATAWGRYLGVCIGYGRIWKNPILRIQTKYSTRPTALSHYEDLAN